MRPSATFPTSESRRIRSISPTPKTNRRLFGLVGGLVLSLGVNAYLVFHQKQLREERNRAVLRQDSTLASKLDLDRQLQQARADLSEFRRRAQRSDSVPD